MSKDKLTDYDATASGNLDVGGVSVAEGMLPSGVNNAIREQMSHQKEAFGLGTPLYVDQTNNRLGVGTTSPTRNISISDTVPYINLVGSTTSAIGMLLGDTDAEIRGALLYDNNADRINLRAGGNTTRVSIDSDGLKFGSDTAAANALDDYEEGSGYAVTDVSGAGLTITTSSSAYTKIGKLVHVSMYLVFPTTSNSTQIQLSLPFAAGSVATSSFSYLNGRLQPGSPLSFESAFTCQVNPSTNNFYVGYNNSTIGSVLTYNQVSGRYILVSGCYHTDL